MRAVRLPPIVRPAAFAFAAALLALLFARSSETALGGATITVNTTEDVLADVSCSDGDCSLRAALTIANPGDTIAFNITSGCFTDICGIGPVAELPAITDDNLTINGFTQTNAVPNSAGPGQPTNASWKVTLDGGVNCGSGCSGLTIDADEVTIKGLVITRFDAAGIDMRTGSAHTGAIIEGNSIGVNVFGTLDSGNDIGIDIGRGSGHRIGGPDPEDRNLIGGNGKGISIVASGGASSGHIIQGNIIGLNAAGSGLLVTVSGPATQNDGITISGGDSVVIGGDTPAERNVISGHQSRGVFIIGGAFGNTVSGNYIGTDITGAFSLENQTGVIISSPGPGNAVGGDTPGERNVISGNDSDGVAIFGVALVPPGPAVVSGNYIGVDASGLEALSNGGAGVHITDSANNLIGGDSPGERNVVGSNFNGGIVITEGGGAIHTTANTVSGNYVGTDATGTVSLAAGMTDGVTISGAFGNTIGGTTEGERNVIAGVNSGSGVSIFGDDNVVEGNWIGVGADGVALSNSNGVAVDGDDNAIGGTDAGAGNLIAFNQITGVLIVGSASGNTGNSILRNSIHSNGSIGIDLNRSDNTVGVINENDADDSDVGTNNIQNFPVLTSAVAGSLTVAGTLDSIASTSFRVEFFTNDACDPTGNGEGQAFVGFEDVVTDPAGDASISHTSNASVEAGDFLTTTATNNATGDTSEFSDCIPITQAPATPTPTPTPVGQTPSPTPTPTPVGQTPSPTPVGQTPTPTPSTTPDGSHTQGDVDCDGDVDESDALKLIFFTSEPIGFVEEDCDIELGDDAGEYPWGDVNCDGVVDAKDALYVLAFRAGITLPPIGANCTPIGDQIA